VHEDDRDTPQVQLNKIAGSGPAHVVEIATVGGDIFVNAVYLRNERGEQLAAFPAAGLDEPRLVALARAAGIHYRRYRIDPRTSHFTSSNPTSAEMFPLAASSMLVRGPTTRVGAQAWIRGRGDKPV
jgi:hypothetical protein